MYSYFSYYLIFALTTGITAYFSIYKPILDFIREEGTEVYTSTSTILDYPKFAAFVLIIISTICAPFILKTVLTGPDDALTEEIMRKFIKEDKI